MTIQVQATPALSTAGPQVTATLSDRGSAHVSIVLFIAGVTPVPVQHDETYFGSKSFTFSLPPGRYEADFQVTAYRVGNALGPVYDTEFSLNGLTAATAKGALPAGKNSDVGFATVRFTVT